MNDYYPPNEKQETPNEGSQILKDRVKVFVGLVVGFVLFVISLPFLEVIFLAGFDLLFGWLIYAIETFQKITIHWSDVFFTLGLLIAICFTINYFGSLFTRTEANAESKSNWTLRTSSMLTLLIVVLFGAGISIVAMAHQCIWMLTSKEPVLTMNTRMRAYQSQSRKNLNQSSLAINNFENKFGQFPSGTSVNNSGEMCHSWITQILPDIERQQLYDRIDMDKPWNSYENREHFKNEISDFYNPMMRENKERISIEGYGLSHYAANVRMLPFGQSLRQIDVAKDGTSQTILLGEVHENLQPWGGAGNLRDPAAGINISPNSFGSQWEGGVHFSLVDGSVQWISDDIDPDVLKALSTPNGGEDLQHDF